MKRLWFKAKRYGYGWYPATWEGWGVLLLYLLLVFLNLKRLAPSFDLPQGFVFPFLAETLILTILLIIVCWKTGEEAKWRWGDEKKKFIEKQ